MIFFFKMAAKHLNSKLATNCSVRNDRQLFICSYPTTKSNQNIYSMYFAKPNCLCMFFSIAFSLQQNANEHHRARFKSLENTPTWYSQSSPITLFLLSKKQSHRKRTFREYRLGFWSIHAHGSALMWLLDVYTARISRMQVNWKFEIATALAGFVEVSGNEIDHRKNGAKMKRKYMNIGCGFKKACGRGRSTGVFCIWPKP